MGGMISKSASQPSPRRSRPRLNSSRGSVQHQASIWDYIAQQAQQRRAPELREQGQAGLNASAVQLQQGQVDPLVQQLGNVQLGDSSATMEVQEEVTTGRIENDTDKIDLTPRVNPTVPGPLAQVKQDDEGWGEIDKLGAWDCSLSSFSAIEEIPAQHREA